MASPGSTPSKKLFIICPIGEKESPTRKRSDQVKEFIIDRVARDKGYETIRSDLISKPGRIDHQIIEHLNDDDIVVADLTDNNPNVFYELAVRHGTRKPVIIMATEENEIPFDLKMQRVIFYDIGSVPSVDHAREELSKQIEAVQSGGFVEDSPIKESPEGRKLYTLKLKPFIQGLSHKDPRVKAYSLENLSSVASSAKVEEMTVLPSRLALLIQDPDRQVRLSALHLYERLNWHIGASEKKRYNKVLLIARKAAIQDSEKDVREQALRAICATGDESITETLMKMIRELPENEYSEVFSDNIWTVLVNRGLGPSFRNALFTEFLKSPEARRKRIEEIAKRRYLG